MVTEEQKYDPNSRPAIDVCDLYSALPGLEPSMSHDKLHALLTNEAAALQAQMQRGELVSSLHLQRVRLARDVLGAASTKRVYDEWRADGKRPTLDELEKLSRRPAFQDARDQLRTRSMRVLLWLLAGLLGVLLLFNALVLILG